MSTFSRYRSWQVTPVWSVGAGAGPGGDTRASFRLVGSGLIPEPGGDFVTRGQHGTMGMPVDRTGWRTGPTDPDDFRVNFVGIGASPAGFPVSFSFSWGDCPSRGSHLWYAGSSISVSQLNGRGMILDASGVVGAGGDLQVLGFNISTNAFRVADAVSSLFGALRDWDTYRLRHLIPMGAVCFGLGFGVSVGITVFEGIWTAHESDELTISVRDPRVGQPLPARSRRGDTSPRSHYQTAIDAWRP